MKVFPVLVQNCNVLGFFRTGNGFQLFEANHVVLNLNLKHNNIFAFCWKFRLFSALWQPKPSLCFFCCCYPVFTFFEGKLRSWPFLGQLTDVSSISLKRTFLLFRCYITLFSAFLHCMEVLVFLQVITMIVTLYHCKECFCGFVAKLRCCQVFLQRKRSSPVGGSITLIVAVSYSNESFSLF